VFYVHITIFVTLIIQKIMHFKCALITEWYHQRVNQRYKPKFVKHISHSTRRDDNITIGLIFSGVTRIC